MYTRQNNHMEKNLHNPNVNGKVVIFYAKRLILGKETNYLGVEYFKLRCQMITVQKVLWKYMAKGLCLIKIRLDISGQLNV